MSVQTIILEGLIPVELGKTYLHLPFEVPEQIIRLDVHFEYTDRIGSNPLLSGGNTLDLGVFDERGIDFLQAGFRGWSGSERDHFFLSEDEATPGYLAGPLHSGTWRLFLGLYKVATQGCTYKAEITFTAGENAKAGVGVESKSHDLPANTPRSPFAPWLRGELHCHTQHSDGSFPVEQLVKRAYERGMDFLAVTDHNTIAAQRDLENMIDPGLILIRGVEATTFRGHFNIWGIPNWIDFRVQTPEQMEAVIQAANDLGGVTSCGHPKPFGPDWEYREVTNYQCVEVWNGPWSGLNEIALEYWTDLLAGGHRKTAVGGSDFHRIGESGGRDIGTPTSWVYLEETPSARKILQAVQAGHVSVSAGPEGPFVDLRGGADNRVIGGDCCRITDESSFHLQITCRGGDGCLLRLFDHKRIVFEQVVSGAQAVVDATLAVGSSMFVRAELRHPDGMMLALTNPIYFEK